MFRREAFGVTQQFLKLEDPTGHAASEISSNHSADPLPVTGLLTVPNMSLMPNLNQRKCNSTDSRSPSVTCAFISADMLQVHVFCVSIHFANVMVIFIFRPLQVNRNFTAFLCKSSENY